MAQQSFSAQVNAWARKSERRMDAVFKESAQRVIAEAQKVRGEGGRMRVDTGFLRASGQVSLSGPPLIRQGFVPPADAGPGSFAYSASPIALEIAGARLGGTIWFGYTAAYAAAREYGARGQAPDAFVRGAAQQWQDIVKQTTARIKARFP